MLLKLQSGELFQTDGVRRFAIESDELDKRKRYIVAYYGPGDDWLMAFDLTPAEAERMLGVLESKLRQKIDFFDVQRELDLWREMAMLD